MSDGCTSCGNKGGCDSRKHGMMAAIDEALAKVYPTKRWGEWDATVAFAEGVDEDQAESLATILRQQLRTTVVRRPGREDELCDYLYILCVGREPALAHFFLPEGPPPGSCYEDAEHSSETYLRVALSTVSKFAGVQEVTLSLEFQAHGSAAAAGAESSHAVLIERPRSGVFSPVLLKRFQVVVAALVAENLCHLDFGDILSPPEGFDAGAYGESFEGPPVVANYFFFPQPSTTLSVLPVRLTSSSS